MAKNSDLTKPQKGAPYRQALGDPYKLLAANVILQAIKDARAGSREAATWLLFDGLLWLEGCGGDVDPDRWQAWVKSGCPRKRAPLRGSRV